MALPEVHLNSTHGCRGFAAAAYLLLSSKTPTHLKTHSGEKSNKCNQCNTQLRKAKKMQSVWLCMLRHKHWCRAFAAAAYLLLHSIILQHIWKHTVEKSQTNAISVTLHAKTQAVWVPWFRCGGLLVGTIHQNTRSRSASSSFDQLDQTIKCSHFWIFQSNNVAVAICCWILQRCSSSRVKVSGKEAITFQSR